MQCVKKRLLCLLMVMVFVPGMLYSKTAMAKLKKGVYFSSLRGEYYPGEDDLGNIKRLSLKKDKLIVLGSFVYSKSKKEHYKWRHTKLKYKKRTFNLSKKWRVFGIGGEGRPTEYTRAGFIKTAKSYNGLDLMIIVDKKGKVKRLYLCS